MKKFLLLFYTLSLCLFLKSQSGSPDPSFGTNGHIFTYSDNSSGVVFSSVPRQSFVLADGKIIMVLQSNNKVKLTGKELQQKLRNASPSIEIGGVEEKSITVTVWMLKPGQEKIVATRIAEELSKASV